MVKTLQRKFIVTAMVAITILITVMLGTINGINVWRSSSENWRMLSALCGRGRADDFKPDDKFVKEPDNEQVKDDAPVPDDTTDAAKPEE
jgi:hypothetical protein